MKVSSWSIYAGAVVFVALLGGRPALGQIDTRPPDWKIDQNRADMESKLQQNTTTHNKVPKEVKVTVDMDKVRTIMAPWAMGLHTTISDNQLIGPEIPDLLHAAGITTLRYPGGRYSDTYHWSTYKPTNFQGSGQPNAYYAPANHLGQFALYIEHVGTTIFTVNYGSNLDGSAGADPAEAASWVAYMNGTPADSKVIGKDSTGYDWQTVGYWATLRASAPVDPDDGKNFLRIQHPAPFGIKYWEVGNEVFQNGYYGGEGLEEDLHAPYPKEAKSNEKQRKKNASLSPDAYGKAVVQFAKAMKAVDPRIKIGVSLDLPVVGQVNRSEWTEDPVTGKYVQDAAVSVDKDFGKSLDWDKGVLSVAGNDMDFVTLHWYAGATTEASGWKDLDSYALLGAPQDQLRPIMAGLADLLQKYCGANARTKQFAFTELGPLPFAKVPESEEIVTGLFAADAYPSLVEYGAVNIDWSELHNNSFLSQRNTPGPAYFGMQMVHAMLNFNDPMILASSNSSMLSVHAAKHQDGSLGLMLINKDPKNGTTVKVTVSGAKLASSGMRFDYGKTNLPSGNSVEGKPTAEVGVSFSVTMPPYTVTTLQIPKAQ